MMTRARLSLLLNSRGAAALLSLLSLCATAGHLAASEEETRSVLERLEDGVAIHNKPLLHSGRFALSPSFGLTTGDLFQRTMLFGLNAEYFISERLSLSVGGAFGLASELPLAEAIRSQRPSQVSAQSFSHIGLLLGGEAQYSPVYGKLSLLGINALRYDLHLIGGASLVQTTGEVIDESAVAPHVGGGLRIFLSKEIALATQLRGYFYSRSENATTRLQRDGSRRYVADSSYQAHPILNVSFSYFFGAVEISD